MTAPLMLQEEFDNLPGIENVGGNSANIGRKRENVERTAGRGEPESSTKTMETVVKLENLEHCKSKRFELSVELEKSKPECTKFKVKLVEVEETRKTAAKVEPEEWNKCSDLESRTLRVENENSTKRCVISNLESLVQRNGKESSTLRCVELRNFEKIESEAWGLQNEVTQAGENHNTSKPNAETSSGGRKDSHVFELKTEENVLNAHGINKHHESESEFHNYSAVKIHSGSLHLSSLGEKVEEGEGWGCSEERPSQHGLSSQDHLQMSTKAFVNLVSDDSGECLDEYEDSDSSGSLGTLMDMMATKYWNRKEGKEMKWKFEADMLSSFEEEPELCMKAVCALYQQHISKDEMSADGLFHYSDALRATTLAKFLMDGACGGDLKKSLKELEKFDSKGVEDCKKLATSYSKQLFRIYQNRKDPNFLLATTDSHEDQTAK